MRTGQECQALLQNLKWLTQRGKDGKESPIFFASFAPLREPLI